MNESTIELKNVYRNYEIGEVRVYALNNVSLNVGASEVIVAMGSSGLRQGKLPNSLSWHRKDIWIAWACC